MCQRARLTVRATLPIMRACTLATCDLRFALCLFGLLALGVALAGSFIGAGALLFLLVQAACAAFVLEAIKYIENQGLQRRIVNGCLEPFAVQHAWKADRAPSSCFIANWQRHSDHHLHTWKPYATPDALPGPQLPSGNAGCRFLASVPPLWFRAMHPQLAALTASA